MFEGYLSHHGRIGRLRFLGAGLLNALMSILLMAAIYIVYEATKNPATFVFLLILLPIGYANIVLCIKRLHDLNLSGWWMLLIFLIDVLLGAVDRSGTLNSLSGLAQMVMYFLVPGTLSANRFGSKPGMSKAVSNSVSKPVPHPAAAERVMPTLGAGS